MHAVLQGGRQAATGDRQSGGSEDDEDGSPGSDGKGDGKSDSKHTGVDSAADKLSRMALKVRKCRAGGQACVLT